MLRKIMPPGRALPVTNTTPAAPLPNGGLGNPKPRMARRKASAVPLTGEKAPPPPRRPNIVCYEAVDGGTNRRYLLGFTRPSDIVPAGWLVEGSPEELEARAEATAAGPLKGFRLTTTFPSEKGTR